MSHILCKGYPDGNPFLNLTASTLYTNAIKFDLNYIPPEHTEGQLHWDDDAGTLELDMPGGEVTLQIGQEIHYRVVNKSGALIPNGSAVYTNGAQGGYATIALTSADATSGNGRVIGIVTEDIIDNALGFITTLGIIRGIDTSAWAPGSPLWLSVTGGLLTNIPPPAPNHRVVVAGVLTSHATEGKIYAQGISSIGLSGLYDVNGTTPDAINKHLVWDNINEYWDVGQISYADLSSTAHTHAFFDLSSTAHTHVITGFLVDDADDTTTGRLNASGFTVDTRHGNIAGGLDKKYTTTYYSGAIDGTTLLVSPSIIRNNFSEISLVANSGAFAQTSSEFIAHDVSIKLDDNGASALPATYAYKATVDGGNSWEVQNSPVFFEYINPPSGQTFPDGFFRVELEGTGSGEQVAAYTKATGYGTADLVGYKGYVVQTTGESCSGTGIGVEGYALDSANSEFAGLIGVHGIVAGAGNTPRDKKMGVKSTGHIFIGFGSIVCPLESGLPTTPNAVTTDHLDFVNNSGELYVGGNTEIDGELFCDGNESGSFTAVTAAYTVADRTYVLASGTFTVTLPTASTCAGRRYTIKNTGTGIITISPNVDGSSQTLPAQYDLIEVLSDGTNYWKVG